MTSIAKQMLAAAATLRDVDAPADQVVGYIVMMFEQHCAPKREKWRADKAAYRARLRASRQAFDVSAKTPSDSLGQPSAAGDTILTEENKEIKIKRERESAALPRSRSKRESVRLPKDWMPTVKHHAEAMQLGYTEAGFRTQVVRFKNWPGHQAGHKSRDWDRVFSNTWLIRSGPGDYEASDDASPAPQPDTAERYPIPEPKPKAPRKPRPPKEAIREERSASPEPLSAEPPPQTATDAPEAPLDGEVLPPGAEVQTDVRGKYWHNPTAKAKPLPTYPDLLDLDDRLIATAGDFLIRKHTDILIEWGKFLAYYRRKGETSVNWHAYWSSWCGKYLDHNRHALEMADRMLRSQQSDAERSARMRQWGKENEARRAANPAPPNKPASWVYVRPGSKEHDAWREVINLHLEAYRKVDDKAPSIIPGEQNHPTAWAVPWKFPMGWDVETERWNPPGVAN